MSDQELDEARAAFPQGRYPIRIEETQFSFAEYAQFLAINADSIAAFEVDRNAAFNAERQDWKAKGLDSFVSEDSPTVADDALPDGCEGILASVTGNVWKIPVEVGDVIAHGDTVVIVEAMKMEMEITSPYPGKVREIRVQPGRTIQAGQIIIVLEQAS